MTISHILILSHGDKMKAKYLMLLLFSVSLIVRGQNLTLENYIKTGLNNNLALKQKTFSLNKSLAALDEARGMFLPSISINARYTRAGGGRVIDIPVGDLVNPIYSGLNQVIGANIYPTNIPNQHVNFLREKEHETKVSLIQPIFQPAVYYNYQIKSNLTEIEKAERDVFIRALVADIKTAYYNYLKTEKAVQLYEKTEILLNENLRVSKSLFNNDKVTEEVVFRAEAELSKLLQEKADAEKNRELAKSYFNFLLNKDLKAEVLIDEDNIAGIRIPDLIEAQKTAAVNREEFKQIDYSIEAADNAGGLSKANYLPGITLAVDYGFQGEEYKFTKDDDFWMASVVLRWNLFNGFSDKAKTQQAEWQKKIYKTKKEELKNQINLQVDEAYQNLIVSQKSIKAAEARLKSARKGFEIVSRKFKEGIASQIEFIDAQTTLTQAEINKIVTEYNFQTYSAELEKITASYPVNNIEY